MNSLTNLALAPVTGKPSMSPASIQRLASVEYDFVRVDTALSELAETLHKSAHDAPSCIPAVLSLKKLRKDLRRILASIDQDVTDAIVAAESLSPPPF